MRLTEITHTSPSDAVRVKRNPEVVVKLSSLRLGPTVVAGTAGMVALGLPALPVMVSTTVLTMGAYEATSVGAGAAFVGELLLAASWRCSRMPPRRCHIWGLLVFWLPRGAPSADSA